MNNKLLTKIILFTALFSYSWVVGQSYMYVIALEDVQMAMDAPAYIELRQLLDTSFRANFKFVVIGALASNLLLVIVTVRNCRSLLFITAALSFLALIVDTLLTLKGNVPLNNLINTWTATSHPGDWSNIRANWLQIFHYRQMANGSGFVILLAGAIFGLGHSKSSAS
ncbi:DUF1772 domain-containing protein [Leptospira koniambonensis]|uniref:DUF1772 domain-containing protein n=1 Tax=Leptospira koniambonensis TaxID=2484950 RepID=A0A4R9J3Z9_9LEPT|nr:DUF1772 domain-containing protein [Leptospira koniambonensis]TGL31334.1 DUF1772 domain-containing protein [Leptospira koniambonensis]